MKNITFIQEEEKNRILNLHKKFILEQATNTTVVDPTLATNAPATGSPSTNTPQTSTDKINAIQTKINEKIVAKQVPNVTQALVVDGKWGPKTSYAVSQYLTTNQQSVTTTTTLAPSDVLAGPDANTTTQNNTTSSSTTNVAPDADNAENPNMV
jgi:hypothetical protein